MSEIVVTVKLPEGVDADDIEVTVGPMPAQTEESSVEAELREEIADLKSSVIAFCAPWAVTYARDYGLPNGTLSANHYDVLARCGARLVDFKRHDEAAPAEARSEQAEGEA